MTPREWIRSLVKKAEKQNPEVAAASLRLLDSGFIIPPAGKIAFRVENAVQVIGPQIEEVAGRQLRPGAEIWVVEPKDS